MFGREVLTLFSGGELQFGCADSVVRSSTPYAESSRVSTCQGATAI